MHRLSVPALQRALETVLPVIASQDTWRDVSGYQAFVLLEADAENRLTLTATSPEMTACATVSAVPDGPDPFPAILVDPKKLKAILAQSKQDELVLKPTAKGVELSFDWSKFELECGDAAKFPRLPWQEMPDFHALPGKQLHRLITRTEFCCAAKASARYALGGCQAEVSDDGATLALVATEGQNIARAECAAQAVGQGCGARDSCVVPRRSLLVLANHVENSEDVVKIWFNAAGKQGQVETPHARFFLRLIEGRFPPYQDIAAKLAATHTVAVTAGPLRAACSLARIMTDSDERAVQFRFAHDTIVLERAANADVGTATITLPLPPGTLNGSAPLSPRLNILMLQKMLDRLDATEPVAILLGAPKDPVCLRAAAYRFYTMPYGDT